MSAPSLQTLNIFNRLCFGGRLQDLDNPEAAIWKEPASASKQLFGSSPSYKPLKSYSEEFMVDKSEFARVEENRKVYPNSTDEINHNWLRYSADSTNPIREKAALFWMHFIPVIGEGEARVKPLLEIYRKNALGKLEDLFFDLLVNPNFMSFLTAANSAKDKLGFITKSIYHIGSFLIGSYLISKAAMDLVSLRTYFIDPYKIAL